MVTSTSRLSSSTNKRRATPSIETRFKQQIRRKQIARRQREIREKRDVERVLKGKPRFKISGGRIVDKLTGSSVSLKDVKESGSTLSTAVKVLEESRKPRKAEFRAPKRITTFEVKSKRGVQTFSTKQQAESFIKKESARLAKVSDVVSKVFDSKKSVAERLVNKRFEGQFLAPSVRTSLIKQTASSIKELNIPLTNKEKKLTQAISNFNVRDTRLRSKVENTYKKFGLTVKEGDSVLKKVAKGGGQFVTSIGFLPQTIANIADKVILTGRASLTSKTTRKSVRKELLRAGKQTPAIVASSLDPRKPENWVTLIAISAGVGLKGSSAVKARANVRIAKKSLSRTITKKIIKEAKTFRFKGKLLSELSGKELGQGIKALRKTTGLKTKGKPSIPRLGSEKLREVSRDALKNIESNIKSKVRNNRGVKKLVKTKKFISNKGKVLKSDVNKVLKSLKLSGSKARNLVKRELTILRTKVAIKEGIIGGKLSRLRTKVAIKSRVVVGKERFRVKTLEPTKKLLKKPVVVTKQKVANFKSRIKFEKAIFKKELKDINIILKGVSKDVSKNIRNKVLSNSSVRFVLKSRKQFLSKKKLLKSDFKDFNTQYNLNLAKAKRVVSNAVKNAKDRAKSPLVVGKSKIRRKVVKKVIRPIKKKISITKQKVANFDSRLNFEKVKLRKQLNKLDHKTRLAVLKNPAVRKLLKTKKIFDKRKSVLKTDFNDIKIKFKQNLARTKTNVKQIIKFEKARAKSRITKPLKPIIKVTKKVIKKVTKPIKKKVSEIKIKKIKLEAKIRKKLLTRERKAKLRSQEQLIKRLKVEKNRIKNISSKLTQKQKRSSAIQKLELILAREQSKLRKLKVGKQIKAKRLTPATKGGKDIFPFTDLSTGKITNFGSRKLFLKAIKRQQGLIKTGKLIRPPIKGVEVIKLPKKLRKVPKIKKVKPKKVESLSLEVTKGGRKFKINIKKKGNQAKINIEGDVAVKTKGGLVQLQKVKTKKVVSLKKPKTKVKARLKSKQRTKQLQLKRTLNKRLTKASLTRVLTLVVPKQQLKAKTKGIPKLQLKQKAKIKFKIKQKQKLLPKVKQKQKLKVKTKQVTKTKTKVTVKTKQLTKQQQKSLSRQRTKQRTKQKRKLFLLPDTKPKVSKVKGRKKGYNVFVKSKGKFVKLDKTLSKKQARKVGRFLTDKSLSASYKIKKSPENINLKVTNIRSLKKKFRASKAKKPPLKGSRVEKRKHRLDTRAEVKKIQVLRLARSLGLKKAKVRKPKKRIKKKTVKRKPVRKRRKKS